MVKSPWLMGWSAREGNGMLDPVSQEPSLRTGFYRRTEELEVDISSLESLLVGCDQGHRAVMLVNYFGFTDARDL